MTILNRLRSAETFTVSEANDLAYDAGFHGENYALMVAALRGDIDAIGSALALVERMLPEYCNSSIKTGNNEFAAYIWNPSGPIGADNNVEGCKSRPLAILTALFTDLEAKEA